MDVATLCFIAFFFSAASNRVIWIFSYFSLLTIAEETLAEFLSKATGTAVEWVQMVGMKVIISTLSSNTCVSSIISFILWDRCLYLFIIMFCSLVRIPLESLLFPTIVVV